MNRRLLISVEGVSLVLHSHVLFLLKLLCTMSNFSSAVLFLVQVCVDKSLRPYFLYTAVQW